MSRVSRVIKGEELPGTRYRLVQWLGEGALGVVYEAHHVDIERRVAFKILRSDAAAVDAEAEAFRSEARTVSSIGSPYIVEIYDVGELPDGRAWIAMELLGGEALADGLGSPIEPGRAVGILRQICKGLSTAHAAGVVHRDVKPENVVLVEADGRADAVKLVDFGIAALVGQTADATTVGTPAYMAPEQIAGEPIDPRQDVYAVGCVAYEMLTGRLPFETLDVERLLYDHTYSSPLPFHEVAPSVPAALGEVVMRCLAKRADERYPSMVELEAALCEAQIVAKLRTPWDDLPLPPVEEPRRERLRRTMPQFEQTRRRRWPAVVAAGVGALGVLALALTLTMGFGRDEPQDSGQVEQLADAARDAAARASYVYPSDGDPQGVTALLKIVELEAIEGGALSEASEVALGLRDDFAQTLVQLGDRYWDDPNARPFAVDYYAQALLFDPDHERASERVLLTPGELATLRVKAIEQTFTARDLEASRPLAALAAADIEDREAELQKIFDEGTRGSMADQRVACLDVAGSGAGSRGGTRRASKRVASSAADLSSDEQGSGSGGEDEPLATDDGAEAAESNASSRRRDPAGARKLAKKGQAALGAGRTSEAESFFHRALSLDNRNATALAGLARVSFNRGAYQRATSYGRRAVRAAPSSGSHRILLGDALFKLFHYVEARQQYRKAKSLGHPQAKDRLSKVEARLKG